MLAVLASRERRRHRSPSVVNIRVIENCVNPHSEDLRPSQTASMAESSNGGNGNGNWRTESFRDNIVAKLNGHIKALDVPPRTDARQMEANIYQKARSEHEYLAYIARLIVYIRGGCFFCVCCC